MRLANYLYTHNEVEISEGLGEGRDIQATCHYLATIIFPCYAKLITFTNKGPRWTLLISSSLPFS